MTDKPTKKCPTWARIVMVILALTTILLLNYWRNSVSFEEYEGCVIEYGNLTSEYAGLGLDYLNLLGCYQGDLPTCEPLIKKYGTVSVFKQYTHSNCANNWYLVEGTNSCCPEPNMRIVDNSCVSNWKG